MPNWLLISIAMCVLECLPSLAHCSNSTDKDPFRMLGSAFAAGPSEDRASFSMVLPDDSEMLEGSSSRRRRHVACGKRQHGRPSRLTFEQRSICPFRHHRNVDHDRIPMLLEEVRCLCDRPSHLSPYSEIRCQPLMYRIPVLRRSGPDGVYVRDTEEVTLACIPLKPKDDSDELMVEVKTSPSL